MLSSDSWAFGLILSFRNCSLSASYSEMSGLAFQVPFMATSLGMGGGGPCVTVDATATNILHFLVESQAR